MTLYLRLGAYLAAVLLCVGIGWHLGSLGPKRDLAALQAQDWQAKFTASQVALAAVQAQLKEAQSVSANNSSVIQGLQDANAKITADRAADMLMASRLLDAARRAGPAGGALPQAGSGQSATAAASNPSLGQIEGLLVDAADESAKCAAEYNALLAELKPQL